MSILKLSDPLTRIRTASTYASEVIPVSETVDLPFAWDTFIRQDTATTNNDASVALLIGEMNSGVGRITRGLIKIDWSLVPANKLLISQELLLTPTADLADNASAINAHRILRDTNSAQATYNIWKTSNNWGTAGCKNSTTDYDGAKPLGIGSIIASPTLNVQLTAFTFTDMDEMNKLYDGTYTDNGIVLFTTAELNDCIQYASQNHATPSFRPVVRTTYI